MARRRNAGTIDSHATGGLVDRTGPIQVVRRDPGGPPAAPAKRSRSAAVIAVLSMLTALLTLATSYLGYQTAKVTHDKETAAAQNSTQVDDLQQQVTQLQQDNDGLRSRLGLPPTSAAAGGADVAGTVRHAGQITFVAGPGIDLDAPASDPKWGLDDGGFDADLYMGSNGSISVDGSTRTVYTAGQRPDYAACSQNTTYRSGGIDRGLAQQGTSFCLRTGENRYAAMTILAIEKDQATLDITTWEKAD